MEEKFGPANNITRPKRINAKPGRVDLKLQEFESLIIDQGIWCRITPCMLCPNRDEINSTNHKLDCPLCGGDEMIDLPEYSAEAWAILQGIKFERHFEAQGLFDFRDAQLTTPSHLKMGYLYKVEVLDFAFAWNEAIKRSTDNMDTLRYVPANNSNIPTYAIDSSGIRYKEERDFVLDPKNKSIKWKQSKPKTDTLYSIIYPALPTFRVIQMLHENRLYYSDFKKPEKTPYYMPQQCVVRWDYLALNSGARTERNSDK